MRRAACIAVALAGRAAADVPADAVPSLPDFPARGVPFQVYSGYLTVKGPFEQNPYDELRIHYQLHTSQRDPAQDPVVTWHQGGPGGSSLYGGYSEMGYFQLMQRNKSAVGEYNNPFAWNRVANMLYLESPAGSSDPIGFSYCLKGGKVQGTCKWNDTSQAEAYAHTLLAFYDAFPEYKANDLFFTGESYAGQYVPNIANYILTRMPGKFNLKGIALGNACTHKLADSLCQAEHPRFVAQLLHGKGLLSKKLYDKVAAACGYNGGKKNVVQCEALQLEIQTAAGPYNTYNVYDDCPGAAEADLRAGAGSAMYGAAAAGGYDWSCGGMAAMKAYFERGDVQKAMHLEEPGQSRFSYSSSGPESITLYPSLAKQLRVLIFNGDADACVPYIGNEEWTTQLAAQGALVEDQAWHPWYVAKGGIPAGYATTYTVPGASTDFAFVTVRLAGHMVPTFQPASAFAMVSRWLQGAPF